MRCITLSVASLAVIYRIIQHDLTKGTIFGEKVIERPVCFDFLCKCCQKYFSSSKDLNEIVSPMYIGLNIK
jgi:hypothetical protein